jgi:hypothetical protein
MTHATKAAAAAALALGLVITATAGAQAETRSAQAATTSTTTTARIATVHGGADITAQAHRFRGIGPSRGSHLNDKPTHLRLDPICRHCAG